MLALLARFITSTYSLVYPPLEVWREHPNGQAPMLTAFSSAYVSPNTAGWLPQFLARTSLIQAINAEIQTESLAKDFGGEPALIASGDRHKHDDILHIVEDIYAPEGSKPSHWSNVEEFSQFSAQFAQSDNCFGTGDRSGMTLETPFGDNSALIRLLSEEPHPQLGNGLLVTLQLPVWLAPDAAAREVAFFNFLEARMWTDFPQLGW